MSDVVMALIHEEITKSVIGAAFEVYRALGYGFLEKVYERAMQVELLQKGLRAELEYPINVCFKALTLVTITQICSSRGRC